LEYSGKGTPHENPEGNLFLQQKRKRIRSQIQTFDIKPDDVGFVIN